MKILIGLCLITVLVLTDGCLRDRSYIPPPECPENSLGLPEGTSKLTQIGIMVAVTEAPKVADDIRKALLDIREVLSESVTGRQVARLINLDVAVINGKYGKVVAVLTPEMTDALSSEIFSTNQYLDYCQKHRLIAWVDKNLDNLDLLGV